MNKIYLIGFCFLAMVTFSFGQTDADKAAIKATALDYMEGWYEGSGERMGRSLHPELAKRMFSKDATGKSVLNNMGAAQLTEGARRGFGKNTPQDKQRKDVTILDIFENVASVRADMSDWIDYMHIAKVDGKWVIINVLWEMRPKKKE